MFAQQNQSFSLKCHYNSKHGTTFSCFTCFRFVCEKWVCVCVHPRIYLSFWLSAQEPQMWRSAQKSLNQFEFSVKTHQNEHLTRSFGTDGILNIVTTSIVPLRSLSHSQCEITENSIVNFDGKVFHILRDFGMETISGLSSPKFHSLWTWRAEEKKVIITQHNRCICVEIHFSQTKSFPIHMLKSAWKRGDERRWKQRQSAFIDKTLPSCRCLSFHFGWGNFGKLRWESMQRLLFCDRNRSRAHICCLRD